MIKVNYYRNHYDIKPKSLTLKSISELSTLSNNSSKSSSAMWNIRNENFLIYDYDHINLDLSKIKKYNFYYHATHSNKYRLIFPIDKDISLPQKKHIWTKTYIETGITLGIDVDTKCSDINRRYYTPPTTSTEIKYNSGLENIKIIQFLSSEFKGDIYTGNNTGYYDIKLISYMYFNMRYFVDFSNLTNGKTQIPCLIHPSHRNDNMVSFNANGTIHAYYEGANEKINNIIDPKLIDLPFTIRYLTACIIDKKINQIDIICAYLPNELRHDVYKLVHLDIDSYDFIYTFNKCIFAYIKEYNNIYYNYNPILKRYEPIPENKIKADIQTMYRVIALIKTYPKKTKLNHDKGLIYVPYVQEIYDGIILKNRALNFNDYQVIDTELSSSIFSVSSLDYDYDKNADCPNFKNALAKWFDGKDPKSVLLLQEFFGYCLTNSRKYNKFLSIYGVAGSGKSALCKILKELVGGISKSLRAIIDPRELPQVDGYKVWYADDVDRDLKVKSILEQIKTLTQEDKFNVRLLGGNTDKIIQNFPKLAMTFNNADSIDELEEAVLDRAIVIKFNTKLRGTQYENKDFVQELRKEYSGILNWAIKGLERLNMQQKFTDYNEVSLLEKEVYEAKYEELKDHIENELRKDKYNQFVYFTSMNLYNIYKKTCFDNKITLRKFVTTLPKIYKFRIHNGSKYYNPLNKRTKYSVNEKMYKEEKEEKDFW